MKVLLVGNYPADRQESMQRFAQLLLRELPRRGVAVDLISPDPAFNLTRANRGFGKYLGYVDKLLLFPRRLKRHLASDSSCLVHICDHSNAFYVEHLRTRRHLVTCHDLLAIRCARGEFPEQATGWTGRRLQNLIRRGLDRAHHIVCVSGATQRDLLRLTSVSAERSRVIYNGLNYPFAPMAKPDAEQLLQSRALPPRFLLHVGGDHWYKNRLGLLEIYANTRRFEPATSPLVLAGAPLSSTQQQFVESTRLGAHVHSVPHPSNEELCALYSTADLMLFPSLVEGFGWPIIEAQACGCPVITSDVPPMNEIAGNAAVYIDPKDPMNAARRVAAIVNEGQAGRAFRSDLSLRNAGRFSTDSMIEGYVRAYEELRDLDTSRALAPGVSPVAQRGKPPLHARAAIL